MFLIAWNCVFTWAAPPHTGAWGFHLSLNLWRISDVFACEGQTICEKRDSGLIISQCSSCQTRASMGWLSVPPVKYSAANGQFREGCISFYFLSLLPKEKKLDMTFLQETLIEFSPFWFCCPATETQRLVIPGIYEQVSANVKSVSDLLVGEAEVSKISNTHFPSWHEFKGILSPSSGTNTLIWALILHFECHQSPSWGKKKGKCRFYTEFLTQMQCLSS